MWREDKKGELQEGFWRRSRWWQVEVQLRSSGLDLGRPNPHLGELKPDPTRPGPGRVHPRVEMGESPKALLECDDGDSGKVGEELEHRSIGWGTRTKQTRRGDGGWLGCIDSSLPPHFDLKHHPLRTSNISSPTSEKKQLVSPPQSGVRPQRLPRRICRFLATLRRGRRRRSQHRDDKYFVVGMHHRRVRIRFENCDAIRPTPKWEKGRREEYLGSPQDRMIGWRPSYCSFRRRSSMSRWTSRQCPKTVWLV